MVKTHLLYPEESLESGMYVPGWCIRPWSVERHGRLTNTRERRHLVPRLPVIRGLPKPFSAPGTEVEYRVVIRINGETLAELINTTVALQQSRYHSPPPCRALACFHQL